MSPRVLGGTLFIDGVVKLILVNITIVPTLKHSRLKWPHQIPLNG